jgi:two-component system, cell cycle sensor histidine kinase and response regulator CckA
MGPDTTALLSRQLPLHASIPAPAEEDQTSSNPFWRRGLGWAVGVALGVSAVWTMGTTGPTRHLFWFVVGAGSSLALTWVGLTVSRRQRNFGSETSAEGNASLLPEESQSESDEELRHQSECSLRFLLSEAKGQAFFMATLEGRVSSWSPGAEDLFGFRPNEVLGRHFSRLFLEEDRAAGKPEQGLTRALADARFKARGWLQRKDGTRFLARVVMSSWCDKLGRICGLLVLVQDVSDHQQAREELRCSKIMYRNLTETARDVVVTISLEGTITSLNRAFEKLTGWPRETWVGRPFTALIHPDDRVRAIDMPERFAREGGTPVLELRMLCKSGEPLAVEFTATPQVQEDKLLGLLGIARDISGRKQVEETLRKTEEQLRQAQKMEAVGRLAGGVAHDFNNLLTVILGCSEILLESFRHNTEAIGFLNEIQRSAEAAASLTRQLLAFSRKQILQPSLMDLNGLVTNLEKMLRRLIGEDIQMVTTLHPMPLPVKADFGQLEQVLMNLVVNARDAMPSGGNLLVTTGLTCEDREVRRPGDTEKKSLPSPAPCAVLSVKDTGHGMDEHVKAHLFEPFFTTKSVGKGTGLGLATVYGIIQQSGGFIEVASEPGQGTEFKVYLPIVAGEPVAPAKAPSAPVATTGTETILVVEDEDGVRTLACHTLRTSGYTVLEARDGLEALSQYERYRGTIQLVLTDVVMPLLSGVQLVHCLLQRHPRLRVLYMSGYHDSALARHGAVDEEVPTLEKPFKPEELTGMVRAVLDRPVAEEPEFAPIGMLS